MDTVLVYHGDKTKDKNKNKHLPVYLSGSDVAIMFEDQRLQSVGLKKYIYINTNRISGLTAPHQALPMSTYVPHVCFVLMLHSFDVIL